MGLLLVAALFVQLSATKRGMLARMGNFCPTNAVGLFWTESAFHYHYAQLAATGAGIPECDRRMQYPEGIRPDRDETPMMERFAGWMYRRQSGPAAPFHVYLMSLVCAYSTLVLFPAFFFSLYLWRSALAGVVSALFYALTYTLIGDVVLGAYVRQDFILPFLFGGTWLLAMAADSGRRWLAAGAAVLLAFSCAAWHLAQFYYLVLLTGLAGLYFARSAARERIARALTVVTLGVLALSLLSPALRHGRFPLSGAMLVAYALLIQHGILRRRTASVGWRFLLFGILLSGGRGAALLLAGDHYAQYSHVYRLVLDKIRFLGIKPADPAQLSFESRVMWTSSFLSPSPATMFRALGGAWPAALAGGILLARDFIRDRRRPPGADAERPISRGLLLWLTGVFIILFALIQRMEVFAAFFVCVLAGNMVPAQPFTRRGAFRLAVVAALVAFSFWNIQRLRIVSHAPPADQLRPLIAALGRHTRADEPILAAFPLSPVICAHLGRPVMVHSKFENRRVREKVEEFYTALFQDEDVFYRFCRRYNAAYFIFEPAMWRDTSPESLRYFTDRLGPAPDSAAERMFNQPLSLKNFELVYAADAYRVFRVK